MAILGNSFSTYSERWGGPPNLRPSTTRPDKLLQLVEQGEAPEGGGGRQWAVGRGQGAGGRGQGGVLDVHLAAVIDLPLCRSEIH